MEKLFWGMVGGCTIAFGILLAMYLNQTGAFDAAEEETTTAVLDEAETQETETGTEETVAEGEYPADIRSLIENSQGNYATAMLVFEEESERAEAAASEENRPNGQPTGSSTLATTQGNNSTGKTGSVDGGRNDNHEYFLEQPSETQEESYLEEESTQDSAESKNDSDFQYDLYRDHVVIKKYTGSATSLDIPDTFEGKPVTEIGDSAFSNSKSLVRISMPDTVTRLGKNAFKGCALLVDIDLSEDLTEMGEGVFDSCERLARISIPDGVTTIGKKAFNECADIIRVTLPGSIESIGEQAFYNCSKMELTKLPSDLKNVDKEAFYSCYKIELSKWPSGLERIEEGAFEDCFAITAVKLPSTLKKLDKRAFYSCTGITELTIKSGLEAISAEAFAACTGIKELTVPKSVISIGDSAFSGCDALESVEISKNTLSIGASAFTGCPFTEVKINKRCSYQTNSFPFELTEDNYY